MRFTQPEATHEKAEPARADRQENAAACLRELIAQGLNSGAGRVLTQKLADAIKMQALGSLRRAESGVGATRHRPSRTP